MKAYTLSTKCVYIVDLMEMMLHALSHCTCTGDAPAAVLPQAGRGDGAQCGLGYTTRVHML